MVRISRWNYAFNFALENPLIGSSYLGVWAFDDIIGSIHSSYFDILFRTGFIGFILYIFILIDLINYFFKNKEYLILAGMVSLLSYGISYEALLWTPGLCLMSVLLYIRCKDSIYLSKKLQKF
jgi:O-antigen ligase